MMPNNRPRPLPRRHSLSSGDESFHPHPAQADGLPRPDSQRRARLPRSKSTSNVFDALSRARDHADYRTGNVVLEQVDVVTLRELANALRTGPLPDCPATHNDCLRLSGSGEPRRWPLQPLRRNKHIKLQRGSLQSHLPENVIPGSTAQGHRSNAISTPVPKMNSADGPWFRSQYPVFLPSSLSPLSGPPFSPGAWAERSLSKEPSFSSTEKATTLGDGKKSPGPKFRPSGKGHSRTRALSNRVSTDNLSRAMSNPIDEGNEPNLGVSFKMLGSQRDLSVEQVQIQTLPLVAVDEEETDRLEGQKQVAPTHEALVGKPSADGIRRQSPSAFLRSRGSPHSPGRCPRRLENIHVQLSLAMLKENLAPESPGFPNMLVTFPCPPKGPQSLSPANPSSPAPTMMDGLGLRPIIQPRMSSRCAATSTSAPAASLNEIVMRKRPSYRHTKPDRPTHARTTVMIDAPWESRSPTSASDIMLSNADQGLSNQPRPFGPSCEGLVAPSCGGGEQCQRGSLASQLTATTGSSRQSTSVHNSSHSSSTSEASTQIKPTVIAQKAYSEATQLSEPIDLSIAERCAIMENMEPRTAATGKDGVGLTETDNPDLDEMHEKPERPLLRLSTTLDPNAEANPQTQGIIERRLARKAKVREYKMRDLDASRADVVDSPVLGYFQPSISMGCDSPLQGASASIHCPRRPSTLSMATTVSKISNNTLHNTNAKAAADFHYEHQLQERSQVEVAGEVSRKPNVQLKISAVNATNIEPIYPPTPHWQTSGITMSPIMVVADVESRPGSPTLRFSALTRPESSNARVRLRPLKISPHSRQKSLSVTISRNSTTGMIERSASVSTDPKFNRRSFMTMPTPPMSPEATKASKRLSLPPMQLNLSVTAGERTSPSRCQEWHSSHTEEREPESTLRSTALKERVMREKLQKDKEITDIVAKTVGLPQKQTVYSDELDPLPLEQNNTESLEKRLKRLERNNDAWLSAMKPLLEAMARTLHDMRVDDRSNSLRMSDFVIDMEAEARQVTHS